jgi:hypothetical protein
MIGLLHEPAADTVMTVDEFCELAHSLGQSNALNERHALASLRLPAPGLSRAELDRIQQEAHAGGLDCYLDANWLVLEPDAAAMAEQEFFELQDQVREACDHLAAAPWLRRLRERGGFVRKRLVHLARGA